MSGITNLYPPIVTPYLPAFDKTSDSYQIEFQLSSFNAAADFNLTYTQIRIDHQNSNDSALNATYTTGIKFVEATLSSTKTGWYQVTIPKADFTFDKNKYYKVQIRMSGNNITVPTDNKHSIEWEKNNKTKCSVWSTVCLIKGITPPTVTVTGLNSTSETTINVLNYTIGGIFTFETGEKEYVKSYQVALKKNDTIIYTSNTIYTEYNTPNQINYAIKYRLDNNTSYTLILTYITNNMFEGSQIFNIKTSVATALAANLNIEPRNIFNEGIIEIIITPKTTDATLNNNLVISRSSSLTNFTIWEDIHSIEVNKISNKKQYVYYDMTPEYGVYYKYAVQAVINNVRTLAETTNMILSLFEDSFLTTADRQLSIRFNPQVNSFSKKISESITDTIGSKYPFIRRNGDMEYSTFTISGLISICADEQRIFTNDNELFGADIKSFYQITTTTDEELKSHLNFLYEKKFRDKVVEFLYDNSVKLFRSPSEGNILVKLTNISFSPETSLGRMLYTFSATANEIAEVTVDNYINHNILKLNKQLNISIQDETPDYSTISATDSVIDQEALII